MYDFEYGIKDEAAIEAMLLTEAMEEAHFRAAILATAAGSKLGSIKSISHSFQNAYTVSRCAKMCMFAPTSRGAAPEFLIPDFNPEDISVECSVSATWYLDAS